MCPTRSERVQFLLIHSKTSLPPFILQKQSPWLNIIIIKFSKKQMDIMHGHELKHMEDIPTSKKAYIFSFDISHIPAKIQCCAALQLKILIFNQPLRLFHLYWSLYCVFVQWLLKILNKDCHCVNSDSNWFKL